MADDRDGDLSWIDGVADCFEQAWRAGRRPRLEDYLGDAAEPGRSLLLEELLRVEVQLCGDHDAGATREDYRRRFPDHAAVIDRAFERLDPEATRFDGEVYCPDTRLTTPGQGPAGPGPGGSHEGDTGPIRYFGDYALLERIGGGAMGVVYRAQQRSLKHPVAVKLIRAGHWASGEEVRRFLAEAIRCNP